MSVYIKGMEMPRGRGEYELRLYVDSDGTCTVEGSYCSFEGEPFEAVPVPPHGRLIDAGKIGLTDFEIILCQKGNPFKNALEMLLEKIENAPTVLEAEESKI